ncbi:cytochrome P450 monooxygenase pc-3 [Mycena floridula]|nr:cytochrome P450 monooxygenase pc-3 [Mycena floridula]
MPSPPGFTYLLDRLPGLLLPIAAVIACSKLNDIFFHLHFHGFAIPVWLLAILLVPATFLCNLAITNAMNRRKARQLGARLPPDVYSALPLGLSFLVKRLAREKNRPHISQVLDDSVAKYGQTFNVGMLAENRYYTTEPEHIKTILATQFDQFEKGYHLRQQFQTLLGDGVFNSDGELWKFHRSMTRPFFSRDRISDFDIFEKHADETIRQIKRRLGEGYPVDIQDAVSRFTLDSATTFLFGKDVESLSAGLPYPHDANKPSSVDHPSNMFVKAFTDAQDRSVFRSKFGRDWPLAEFWRDRVVEPKKGVDEFIVPIVKEAIRRKVGQAAVEKNRSGANEKNSTEREVQEGESLLDHLVHHTTDPKILRDETLNILLAGRDTTACTLTFATYMLAEHPEVLKKLRLEVLERLGRSGRPTFEDMREMKYMRAVINETLRLYPAVPFNVRYSNQAALLPNRDGSPPFYVPQHTRVVYSVFLMQRRKDIWGPDADKFDPERFLDARVQKYITSNPFAFLPFNAGPRICLGQQFAYHEASFFLVRLVQSFVGITLTPDAQPPKSRPPEHWGDDVAPGGREKIYPAANLTLYAKGGCWVTFQEASD